MNINNEVFNEDSSVVNEIDLFQIISELWNKKFLISSITSIFAVLSVLYALYLPNIFTSSALLAPADDNNTNSGMMGQFSSVASLAGISIGGESADKSIEAIERIRSYEFFSKYFLPEISLKNLVAVDRWDSSTDIISYENDVIDDKGGWIEGAPSYQDAYKVYSDIVSISQDRKTFFITLSVKHKSPIIAKKWTEIIIKKINSSMRNQDKLKATKSLDFLNSQLSKVNFQEIRLAISSLQETQMKSLMLIESNDDYVFKVIDSPIVPEKKSEPKRSLIAILGTVLGFFLSLLTVSVLYIFKKQDIS